MYMYIYSVCTYVCAYKPSHPHPHSFPQHTCSARQRRAQTAQTKAVAEELSTFFKLLLLAIKGTKLLSILTDWLQAPTATNSQTSSL